MKHSPLERGLRLHTSIDLTMRVSHTESFPFFYKRCLTMLNHLDFCLSVAFVGLYGRK